jgi:hypothetical protein
MGFKDLNMQFQWEGWKYKFEGFITGSMDIISSHCMEKLLKKGHPGHIVGKDGVRLDPKKIEAMHNLPHPKTLKILCGFFFLMGYCHKFV